MIAGRSAELLRQLEAPTGADPELLARFVRGRDELAFAEIVRRHGPVVLGVCRRVTGHREDAEDAFQAVFLILAQKAALIGRPELIGNWLFGVAVRVAQKARRSVMRRRAREVAVSVVPDLPVQIEPMLSERSPILDEELANLPSWYREAIVLCDMRGASREEASAVLGIPEGTLSSRLANGRKKLAARLTKRGVALSVAAIPTTLSVTQAAVIPNDLLVKTCGLVADWAAGGTIPKPLARLTEGGMTMRKTFVIGLLSSVLVLSSVVYATHSPENPPPTDPPKEPVVAGKTEVTEQAVPEKKPEKKQIVFSSIPKLRDIVDISMHGVHEVCWNEQGDRIALVGQRVFTAPAPKGNQPIVADKTELGCVFVFAISRLDAPKIANYASFYLNSSQKDLFVGFTPDGKQLLTEHREYQLLSGVHKLQYWGDDGEEFGSPVRQMPAFNPMRRSLGMNSRLMEKNSIDLDPTPTQGYYFSADGKTFRTIRAEQSTSPKDCKLHVLEIDAATGYQLKSLLTVDSGVHAMSSDGKRLAVISLDFTVAVYDVDRGAKMYSFKVPSDVKKSDAPAATVVVEGMGTGIPSFGGQDTRRDYSTSWITFSPDGQRLLVTCGIGETINFRRSNVPRYESAIVSGGLGQCIVLNANTGDRLPALEGAECLLCIAHKNSFSADGRLLVLSGSSYNISKQKLTFVGRKMDRTGKPADKQEGEQIVTEHANNFLTVWDTQTGKVVKTWNRNSTVAINPIRPILAVIEPNEGETRLGLWDFSAEVAEKK